MQRHGWGYLRVASTVWEGDMPCEWYEKDGTVIHVHSRSGGSKRLECKFCHETYSQSKGKLCDFPIGHGKTCDAAMCNECTRTIGNQHTEIGGGMKRLNDTIDVCPIHRGQPFPKN
jgi:hypothetical protein